MVVKTFLLLFVLLATVTAVVVAVDLHDRPATNTGVPDGCVADRPPLEGAGGLSCGPVRFDHGLM
jgi:hypothetical protein